MTLFRNRYRIESTRFKGWDYSNNGLYFVTICTKNRNCCLGEIINNKFVKNDLSVILDNNIRKLPTHYSNCSLEEYIIMPNHIHLILKLYFEVETGLKPVSTEKPYCLKPVSTEKPYCLKPVSTCKQYSLTEIIRGLKTFSSKKINATRNTIGHPFWQKGYYDRIIRNEKEHWIIKNYIQNNPKNWSNDRNNI